MGDDDKFTGFSIPDGAWIPPELVMSLSGLSGNELKMMVVILYNELQVGGGSGSSTQDLVMMTGLSRATVHKLGKQLVETGMVYVQNTANTNIYYPTVRGSVKNLYTSIKLRKKESLNTLTDSSLSLNLELLSRLRENGVYLKTAVKILSDYSAEAVEQHLRYYAYALVTRLAVGPGYLVESIKNGWGAPLGYEEKEDGYKKYSNGEYSGLIDN